MIYFTRNGILKGTGMDRSIALNAKAGTAVVVRFQRLEYEGVLETGGITSGTINMRVKVTKVVFNTTHHR